MWMIFLTFAFVGVFSGSQAVADELGSKFTDLELVEAVKKRGNFKVLEFDADKSAELLAELRRGGSGNPLYNGVSTDVQPITLRVQRSRASSKTIRWTGGGALVRRDNSTMFALGIKVPNESYYYIILDSKEDKASIRLYDREDRVESMMANGTDGRFIYTVGPFQGSLATVIVEMPPTVEQAQFNITQIIPLDWPSDPNALFPGNHSILEGSSFAPDGLIDDEIIKSAEAAAPGMSPLVTDVKIPDQLLDYACMSDHGYFGRFAQDPRSRVNSIGVLQLLYFRNGVTVTSLCTGTIVTFDRTGTTHILTANHCLVGDPRVDAQRANFRGGRLFLDYRNATCGANPPPRWAQTDFLALPQLPITRLHAGTTETDTAILDIAAVPAGRTPFRAGGTPSYVDNDVMRLRLHHGDVRPLLGSEPFWDWRPDIPELDYDGACETLGFPGANFYYSATFAHNKSSVTTGGTSGSAIIAQNGNVVGPHYGTCRGRIGGFYAIFEMDGKIERTLDIVNFPVP